MVYGLVLVLHPTYSVLFIVPTQIFKERVNVSKSMKSNLEVVKGMLNKSDLGYAAIRVLYKYSGMIELNINLRSVIFTISTLIIPHSLFTLQSPGSRPPAC